MLKVGNRHWHTRIDSKTAAFHPNEKSNQFCSTRPVFLSWLWTWIRLMVGSCWWNSACLCALWSYNKQWSNGIIMSYISFIQATQHLSNKTRVFSCKHQPKRNIRKIIGQKQNIITNPAFSLREAKKRRLLQDTVPPLISWKQHKKISWSRRKKQTLIELLHFLVTGQIAFLRSSIPYCTL